MKKLITNIAIGSLLTGSFLIQAQEHLTLYSLPNVPQSSFVNPVAQPDTFQLSSVGLPLISSIYFGFSHDGFVYSDLIKQRDDDSLYLDLEGVLSEMKDVNKINVNLQTDLLSLRMKIKKNYITFNMSERVNVEANYPKELFELAYYGNGNYIGETVNITGLGVNAQHYREYGLGWSRYFGDLMFGVRAKYLAGISNVQTESSNISLYTAPNTYDLTLGSTFYVQTAGLTNENMIDPVEYLFYTNNRGFAADFGASYTLMEKINISASVLDIGSIKWQDNLVSYYMDDASFTYSGVDLAEMMNDTNDFFSTLIDSAISEFTIQKDSPASTTYTTTLPTKLNLSVAYQLTPTNTVGALLHGTIGENGMNPALTLSYLKEFGRIWNVGLSYSMKNGTYNNIGIASALKLGPFQFYVVTDNILAAAMPQNASNVDIQLGMNIVTYKKKPKFTPSRPKL